MDTATLAEAVLAEALKRYDQGGWDVLVECWTTEEFERFWADGEQFGTPRPTTVAEAITSVEGVVSVWADQQADARNSAF